MRGWNLDTLENSYIPLVTCIMPTLPERQELSVMARECFHRQTYPRKELITDSSALSIGAKRNRLCGMAAGEIVIHWDDDDWSDPRRIDFQVAELTIGSGESVTGFNRMLYYDSTFGQAWLYEHAPPYALGTSLCYWKSWWQEHPFNEDVKRGEDTLFCREARAASQLSSQPILGLIVARHHGVAQPRPRFNDRAFSAVDNKTLPERFMQEIAA